jgi:hypothetical protein
MSNYGFNNVCYQTQQAAQKAACDNHDFWNRSSDKTMSCLSYATDPFDSKLTNFTLRVSDGSASWLTSTRQLSIQPCDTSVTYNETFSYVLFSVMLAYLTSLLIGAIIKFIRSV